MIKEGRFKVVILSARASNLRGSLGSVIKNEPQLARTQIIVVDDGARAGWPDAPASWIQGVKPFVFARNANIGIRSSPTDTILMNDDATLETLRGFSRWAEFMASAPGSGPCSAAIDGVVGNCEQTPRGTGTRRKPTSPIAFVCVYLPWTTYVKIGPLDERFTGYGKDDRDYCERSLEAGLPLGIFDPCVVRHGVLPSTYRTRPDIAELCKINLKAYHDKKKERQVKMVKMSIVTAVSRPHLLGRVKESIESSIVGAGVDLTWILVFDGRVPIEGERIAASAKGFHVKPVVWDKGPSKYGIRQKNMGMGLSEGFYHLLDDDNIVHPNFFRRIAEHIRKNPDKKAFAVHQHRWDRFKDLRVSPDSMKPGRIDNTMFVVDTGFIGEKRYDPRMGGIEDGYFFSELYQKDPSVWVFVDEFLAYYNYLKHFPPGTDGPKR